MKIPPKTSLAEYYKILRDEEHPANRLKRELSEITMRSPNTVTGWCCNGKYPEPIIQNLIAKHLGSTPDVLFPKTPSDNGDT